MTRLREALDEPAVIISCCLFALIPLLLLPIIPTQAAAMLHLALAAPLTTYQLLLFAWRKRTMVLDVLMSLSCIIFAGAAAILFLMSQQAAAHVCIGNSLCMAAVHMMMMGDHGRIVTGCSLVLAALGGGGMIVPSAFVTQRMFQCAAFPLMVLVFELTKRSEPAAYKARPRAEPFFPLRGPIPDFFTRNKNNKKDCDIVASESMA
jgi:hypothetical protein